MRSSGFAALVGAGSTTCNCPVLLEVQLHRNARVREKGDMNDRQSRKANARRGSCCARAAALLWTESSSVPSATASFRPTPEHAHTAIGRFVLGEGAFVALRSAFCPPECLRHSPNL